MAPQHEATGGRVRIGLGPRSTQFGLMCGAFCAFALASAVMKVLGEGQAERKWSRFSGLGRVRGPHRKHARVVQLRVSGAA